MNKVLLLGCLVLVAVAHKDKRPFPQSDSVYNPFPEATQFSQTKVTPPSIQIQKQRSDSNQNRIEGEENQQDYQELDEMLQYGLIFGIVLLSCMLLKICTKVGKGKCRRYNNFSRHQHCPYRPMQNKGMNSQQIRNQIEIHKNEIKRLQKLAKQTEQAQEREKEKKKEETLKAYYNAYEMAERMGANNYYGQHPQYTYQQNIPIGRPLPRDNDSSFASEYPTI